MPELIDKKRTEAKVFLIARLFIDRPEREVELVKAVIHRCCEEIDKQPTIEPEQRHGRWIIKPHGSYRQLRAFCSACGKHSGIGGIESNQRKPFCPNCGARMYGGADNG